MNQRKIVLSRIALVAAAVLPLSASADISGYVTPSEMTMTFTRVSLTKPDGARLTVSSATHEHTFKKADGDFAATSLEGVTLPAGRFIGAQVCYTDTRSVKLDGDIYHGGTSGLYSDGTPIYSTTAATALTNGSVTTVAPSGGGVTLGGYTNTGTGGATEMCSESTFGTVQCLASSSSSCESGDTFIDVATAPGVNLLLDIQNSVGIYAPNNTMDAHQAIYPYPTIGNPGAAIRLTTADGNNITLLFSGDKKLLYAASYGVGSSTGFCNGNSFVTVTGAPAGVSINAHGPNAVMAFDSTTGKVQFATGNQNSDASAQVSGGMLTIANVLGAAGSTVSVSCLADSAADPAYLGYTYTSGSGSAGSQTFTIKRIVDKTGIFASSTGCTGTCGSY